MTTLFRKEYPQKSRATEFFVSHSVYRIDDTDIPSNFCLGNREIIEPVTELYTDVVWASFNTLHNKINPYKEN